MASSQKEATRVPDTKGKTNLRREKENNKKRCPWFLHLFIKDNRLESLTTESPCISPGPPPRWLFALKDLWVLWVSFIVRCCAWSENLPSCLPQGNLDKYVWLGPAFRVESKQSQQRRNTRAILIFYQTEAWPESTWGLRLSALRANEGVMKLPSQVQFKNTWPTRSSHWPLPCIIKLRHLGFLCK